LPLLHYSPEQKGGALSPVRSEVIVLAFCRTVAGGQAVAMKCSARAAASAAVASDEGHRRAGQHRVPGHEFLKSCEQYNMTCPRTALF
jgi:hypothetical protein